MPDTTTDQVAAALAEVRELIAERDKVIARSAAGAVDVREFNAAQDRLAERAPWLLAALEAVQELADEWAAAGPPPRSAAEIERRARAAELRKVIASKLLGEGPTVPGRMPIGHDIDLLCATVTWAVERRRVGTLVGAARIQRYMRVGFVKAQRLMLLMDDYGVTDGNPAGRKVLVTGEQLPNVLAKLRDLAGKETSHD